MPVQKFNTKALFFSITFALAVSSVLPVPYSIATQVSAQSVITAIPPRLVLTGKPGETISAQLKVRNDSDVAQTYLIAVDDFIVSDKEGTPIPVSQNVSGRWSLKSWITSPDIIPVDAKATQVVNIKVKVPLTALPGGHYAMLTYMPNTEVKPGDLKKTASIIGQRVGSLLYFTVSGPVTEKINVTRFSIPEFSERGPIAISGTLESLSDVHVSPKGSITITDPLNNKVADIAVDSGNIFPETSRDFTSTWNQKWGWGRYRADLNLAYGAVGAVATASVFFWLFPIRLVIYSLVAIISILTIITLLNKRNKRHQEQLEREVHELKEELNKLENK